MSSTFREMYDDSLLRIKLYEAKLTYTEDMFMRLFVEGLKKFQRETQLQQKMATLTRSLPSPFLLPVDCFWVLGVTDSNGVDILLNAPEQFRRTVQKAYDKDIPHLDYDRYRQYRSKEAVQRRICSVFDRELRLFPDNDDTSLALWYVPYIESFARLSAGWAAWFADDSAFTTHFNADRLADVFAPYENALIDNVVAELLKIDGNPKYAAVEQSFWQEVERAKNNKQQLFRRGYADYVQSPWR